MSRPSVTIALQNGQLGILPASDFGSCIVLVASPAAPTAGYGVVFLVKTIADVKAAFADVLNSEVVDAFVKGFFAEAPEGVKVWVLAMARTTTLQTLVAAANAEKALTVADGAAHMLAAIKFPDPETYVPTVTNGMDIDTHNAVTDAQTLANAWLVKNKPFRFLIQAYALAAAGAGAKDYSTAFYRNGAIVLAEIAASSATATLLALGRAAKIEPQRNIGRIKDGSLNIADTDAVTLGGTAIENITSTQLDTLYDARYITIERNRVASGFVFTDDNTLVAATDDYNSLSNGRVIDNAVRVAFSTYYKQLKDDVDVDENGRLSASVEKALEAAIVNDINVQMGTQLSTERDGSAAINVKVNPDTVTFAQLYSNNNIASPVLNLLQSGGKVYIFLSMRPKGQLKNISIMLGFEA